GFLRMLVVVWLMASSGWRWFAATHIDHRPDERNAQRARHFGRAVAAGVAAAISFQAVSAVGAPPVTDAVRTRRQRRRTHGAAAARAPERSSVASAGCVAPIAIRRRAHAPRRNVPTAHIGRSEAGV